MRNKVIVLGMFTFGNLLVQAFSTSSALAAGVEIRNGGNAVVCYDSPAKRRIVSIDTFDYWEQARFAPIYANNGAELRKDLGAPSLSIEQKINLFIQRVKTYDAGRAARYDVTKTLLLRDLNAFIVPSFSGEPIDDDHPMGLPQSPCFKEQFAVQLRDPAAGSRRYVINGALFNHEKATNDTKAGILIHEIIYRDAIKNDGALDSDGVRRLNYFYSTVKVAEVNAIEIKKIYTDVGFILFPNTFELSLSSMRARILVSNQNPLSQEVGSIMSYKPILPGVFESSNFHLPYESGVEFQVRRDRDQFVLVREIVGPTNVCSYPAGNFCQVKIEGKTINFDSDYAGVSFEFNSSGELTFLEGLFPSPGGQVASFSLNGFPCLPYDNGHQFYSFGIGPDTKLSGCKISQGTKGFEYFLKNGSHFGVGGFVQFYPSGKLRFGEAIDTGKVFVYGSEHLQNFSGPFEISEDEVLVQGRVYASMANPAEHIHSTSAYDFVYIGNGQYTASGGKLTLLSDFRMINYSGPAALALCVAAQPDAKLYSNFGGKAEIISGTMQFYDLSQKAVVSVTDEQVNSIESFQCGVPDLKGFRFQ